MQATSNIKFEYNGKVYRPVVETQAGRCEGCAFDDDSDGCDEVISRHDCLGIIWQEKQETVKKSEPKVLTWTEHVAEMLMLIGMDTKRV